MVGGLTFVVLRSSTREVINLSGLLFKKRHVTLSANKTFHEGQYGNLIKEKVPLSLDHDQHIYSLLRPLGHLCGTLQT